MIVANVAFFKKSQGRGGLGDGAHTCRQSAVAGAKLPIPICCSDWVVN